MLEKNLLLEVNSASKSFASKKVCKDVSFSLAKGEIGCLLGPSGCGKTTLLRMIAGFEQLEAGSIKINGLVVSSVNDTTAPEKRGIGMVFQDYALFPHLTVAENIGFGLSTLSKRDRDARIEELLELVGLESEGETYPHEISGGQQQRVALARALAPNPQLLLLDEPFSNLDAQLRDRLTVEVRDILKQANTTALLVTHNQHEAFSVADKIGVLFDGRMQQWADVHTIYHNPANAGVATFVGEGSLLPAQLISADIIECSLGHLSASAPPTVSIGCKLDLLVRPEDIIHCDDSEIRAKVRHRSFRGSNILYQLQLADDNLCQALLPSCHNFAIGEVIGVKVSLDHPVLFAQ